MYITNQENIQWVAVTQFCNYVTSKIDIPGADANAKNKGLGEYQNCGQFLLFNGYGSNGIQENEAQGQEADKLKKGDVAAQHLLHRSDLPPTTNAANPALGAFCHNPISSIQAQYGNKMYPSNAIETRIYGGSIVYADKNNKKIDYYLLKTDDLYSEYKKAVGFKNPAVPEDIFKRTMPFFLVRFTPNLKLVQSGDIIIRMPGFKGITDEVYTNTGNKKVSIIYGQLKSFNISPSGIVDESISSF